MSKPTKPKRRKFSEEFKRDAVSLVVSEGYTFRAASHAVKVNENSLRLWHKKYAPEPDPCGPEASKEELQDEVKRLRKQLRQAELEREILKKATAYFAKESE